MTPALANPPSNYPAIFQKTPSTQITKLSLTDVVVLVLANNTEIKNAYLDRIAQKQDLAVAEGKYIPNFTPTLSVSLNQLGQVSNTLGSVDAKVGMRIPTGGEVNFGWTSNTQTNTTSSTSNSFNQNLQLSFRQPLLKGAGISLNRVSIDIARISEKSNIINLKSTLSDTITRAIFAYRELLQAQERVKIEQSSLRNAQESLEVTQILINAGRVAPVDIVQNQTDVANRRFSLLQAENDLESRKLALLSLLDIDKNTNIQADVIPPVTQTVLDIEKLRQLALINQPAYLLSQFSLDRSKLDLSVAEDEKRWDLSLNASLGNTTNTETDIKAGLSLSRVIGDLSLEQRTERARVELRKAQNTLQNTRSQLDIDLQDRVRDVNLSFEQLKLARQATELSQRQLDIEQQKQKLGKSRVLDLVNLQNALAEARNAELNANIRYLNTLTTLDQFIGTTLQTWQVTVEK
jgi:outer membrane protein TolC